MPTWTTNHSKARFGNALAAMARCRGRVAGALRVRSSDLDDRGFGKAGIDFNIATTPADNIVTNSALQLRGELLVQSGVKLARTNSRCFFGSLSWKARTVCKRIFTECPPSRVWVFERAHHVLSGRRCSSRFWHPPLHAWRLSGQELDGGNWKLKWFKPGYKAQRRQGIRKSTLDVNQAADHE